jgi:hypothetical protein
MRLGQIKAFLRIREKDSGPLDFDTQGGIDTTWHRIYLCLRSGFHQEALEVQPPAMRICPPPGCPLAHWTSWTVLATCYMQGWH